LTEPLREGARAPDAEVETDRGRLRLSDLWRRGRLLLAFYYEDATPTCSTQVASLKEGHDLLAKAGTHVVAVSADGLDSHRAFCHRLGGLPFPLASDPDLALAHAYGVVDDSGRRSRRAVFVIDRDGTVLLAEPHYNPANVSQLEAAFRAAGALG
jgi:peroxiredoxin Q/BCP